MTAPRRATYARIVAAETGSGRTWHRRRVYAGVAMAVGALLFAMLLIDPPHERALRAERERTFDAFQALVDGGPITLRPPPYPSAVDGDAYEDWQLRVRDRECALVRRAAESDDRIERVERWRIQRACAAPH